VTGVQTCALPISQRGVILSNASDPIFRKIDHCVFPGSVSNHHLNTLPPLLVSIYEMMNFGRQYAEDVVRNAKAFGAALVNHGFEVECAELGFTGSHQVVLNVSRFGGGNAVADILKASDIIVNQNLLPNDPGGAGNPSGIRLGVQEVTRLGMRESEMDAIARFFKLVIIERKNVASEVHELRSAFRKVNYCFENSVASKPVPEKVAVPNL
jgi:glycine hydroxymethyltransferase